ncbi:uncharacterized protein LOC110241907 [Exaiptasia diaphana]|uniref:UspA domain-containing protein n=1 Tax=Exaiptasia diaphana TaxID=2652724 RepID=A0A913XEI3_EXADI|nr:uncharacterized protein LOC110241907 [Exaiptasia diaphana]KXJ12586.1 Universal stress protein MJ0577 [Exaiptasia diaphana]
MPRTILIAVNASEHSERALNWYLDKSRLHGDQVLFAHVVESASIIPPPTYAHGPSLSREEWDQIMEELHAKAHVVTEPLEKVLEKYVSENEGKDEKKEAQYQTICSVGSPGEAICKMAEDNKVDMVIIGNRGLGTIRRTLLGSVSDYIVQHCTVAVVVVPPEQ